MPTAKSKKTTSSSKTRKNSGAAPKTAIAKETPKAGSRVRAAGGKATEVVKRVPKVTGALPGLGKAEVVVNRQVNGFIDFLREQSVVGLAIGLVLGTQVKQLVDSIVLNFFNPLIGLFLPGSGALDKKVFIVELFGKEGKFGYGAFTMTLLNFLIVAAVVYFIFKGLKLDRLAKKKEEPAKEEEKPAKKSKK